MESSSSFAEDNIMLIFVIVIGLGLYLLRKWASGGWCYSKVQLDGKTVIVTGCNVGIGKETARDFVKRGARVIMACRDLQKANAAAEEFRKEGRGEVVVHELDLASFDSIHSFANKILKSEPKIDIFVNNAGLAVLSKQKTKDGFELTFGTNHLGPFLLTNLLLERIKQSAPARIVNVSSLVHTFASMNWDDLNFDKPGSFGGIKTYNQSKLANVLFTKELANRLKGTNVNVYALHPGAVKTEFARALPGFLRTIFDFFAIFAYKSAVEGAQTTIYCSVAEEVANESGLYYSDCAEKKPSKDALDKNAAKKLWEISAEMVSLKKLN